MAALSLATTRFRRIIGAATVVVLGGCLSVDAPFEGVAVLAIIGGNQQSVPVNTVAPVPLTVRAYNNSALALEGIDVDWSISSGGTISATSSVTDDTGTAAVTFTAGGSAGPVQVRASADGLTVTFNLTIIPAT